LRVFGVELPKLHPPCVVVVVVAAVRRGVTPRVVGRAREIAMGWRDRHRCRFDSIDSIDRSIDRWMDEI